MINGIKQITKPIFKAYNNEWTFTIINNIILFMSLRSTDSVILIGCKGCGKSTHGKMLAEKWELPFFDIDDIIHQMTGLTSRELYLKKGASGFMQIEEIACQKVADQFQNQRIVVSTGSSICDNAPAINALSSLGCFVFLKYDIQSSIQKILDPIFQRDDGSFANLPSYIAIRKPKKMSQVKELITQKFESRYAQYEGIADISVLLKEESPKEDNFNSLLQAL